MPCTNGTSDFYKRKLRSYFRKLDLNKDDYVTYTEVVHDTAARAKQPMSPDNHKQFAQLMENMWKTYWEPLATDKDGEKRVHIDKFVGEFNQDTKQGRELESRTLKLVFREIDRDSDGAISPDEFALWFKYMGIDVKHAESAFMIMDTNGDGKLSREEFVNAGVQYYCDQVENEGMYFWGPLLD